MARLASCIFVATAVVDPTDAYPSHRYWHTITVGGKCLATTEDCWYGGFMPSDPGKSYNQCDLYNGAEVMLWECDDNGYNKWFINLDLADPSKQQPFEIRAGNEYFGTFPELSDWCLDGGDIDADSSLLSIWECNGFPQQQFNADGIDPKSSFQGSFYFPNGKCMDGTESMEQGSTPLAWECNGEDQQIWSTQYCTTFCDPDHYGGWCETICSDDSQAKLV